MSYAAAKAVEVGSTVGDRCHSRSYSCTFVGHVYPVSVSVRVCVFVCMCVCLCVCVRMCVSLCHGQVSLLTVWVVWGHVCSLCTCHDNIIIITELDVNSSGEW